MKTQDEDGYWKDLAERLQAKVAMAESVLERSTKEVERLRADLQNCMGSANYEVLSDYQHEVERLQRLADQRLEHIRSESSRLVQIDAARDKAEAEVERLRKELEQSRQDDGEWKATIGRLNAEVERLRAESNRNYDIAVKAQAELFEAQHEVERLQRELKRRDIEDEFRQPSKAESEIARLQRAVQAAEESEHKLGLAVVRLRAQLDKWKKWSAANPPSQREIDGGM